MTTIFKGISMIKSIYSISACLIFWLLSVGSGNAQLSSAIQFSDSCTKGYALGSEIDTTAIGGCVNKVSSAELYELRNPLSPNGSDYQLKLMSCDHLKLLNYQPSAVYFHFTRSSTIDRCTYLIKVKDGSILHDLMEKFGKYELNGGTSPKQIGGDTMSSIYGWKKNVNGEYLIARFTEARNTAKNPFEKANLATVTMYRK